MSCNYEGSPEGKGGDQRSKGRRGGTGTPPPPGRGVGPICVDTEPAWERLVFGGVLKRGKPKLRSDI